MIISTNARDEAARLASQRAVIDSRVMFAYVVAHLTVIDGAIVVNTKSVCHGIGIVLDSMAIRDAVRDSMRQCDM